MTEKRLLSAAAAARELGVDRSTVKRWIDAGKLPAFKTPGGHWRVRRVDVMKVQDDLPVYAQESERTEVICPKCGRPALEVRRYADGSTSYNHAMHEGPFGFVEVTDFCHVT